MTKTSLAMTLALLSGCLAAGCQQESRGLPERVASTSRALTVDTLASSTSAIGRLSNDHEAAMGQVITAPAQSILKSFTFIVNAPTTAIFRAEIYAWGGAHAAGPSLYESAPIAGTGETQPFTFDTGNLSLTPAAQYVLFLTTSKDNGTGDGYVSGIAKAADSYAGGDMFLLESPASAATWTTDTWLATSTHLVFRANFDVLPSSNMVLSSLATPSVFGQPVNWIVTLATPGSPTGTVTFLDGASPLGSAPLNGQSGFAQSSFLSTTLGVGSHAISAQYSGDVDFSPRSAALSQVVLKANTATLLASSSNPSNSGAAVTWRATVSALSPGAGLATGTVTFAEGGAPLGTSALDGSGSAALTTSTLGLGQHVIAATYGGDANFEPSTSPDFVQTVTADQTTLALGSSTSPSVFASKVTFTATVLRSQASSAPTGTVIFKEGTSTLGTGDLDGTGAAIFSTSALTGGAHTLTAFYGGDPSHAAASGSWLQVVTPGVSTTTLSATPNPSASGQAVVFTAAVTGVGAAPSGSVTFSDGALTLGTASLADNGIAVLTSSALTPGAHAVTASYSGDANFRPSASSGLLERVTLDQFAPSEAGAAGAAGASADAGADAGGSAGASAGGTPSADAGSKGDAGPGGNSAVSGGNPDSGCSIRAAQRAPAGGAGLLSLLAALAATRRRFRRRAARRAS